MRTVLSALATTGAAIILASFTLLTPAQAAEYRHLDVAKSEIRFTYQQMGVKMQGHFSRFDGELSFDPAAAESGALRLDVDLASVDTGTTDGNSELATKDWFNTSAFPQASFVATTVKPLGDGRYEVAGTLTIKGQSKDIIVPARFDPAGDRAVFEGSFTIQRGDFSIGEGAWRAFDIVANDVIIHFHLEASSQ